MAPSSRRRLKAKAAAIDLMASRGDIFDPVRRRRVALTPEEWVRQQTIALLHDRMGYPYELMQVEGAISLNGLTKRCDIVVYDAQVRPRMIVECKREEVPLTQRVADQASRYNLVLGVPYLLLTNGLVQCCLHVENGTLRSVALPSWQELNAEG